MTQGQTYTYTADVRPSVGFSMQLRVYDGNSLVTGSSVTVNSGVWTTVSMTFTAAGPNGAYLSPVWSSGSIGSYLDVRRLRLVEGSSPAPAWEQAYLTSYSGDYDFSSDPDALEWEPGVTAWDFLEPLLQTSGLRLFCDEYQQWHLVDETYSVPGQLNLSTSTNVTEAEGTISRENNWYDSVVVEYSWVDSAGDPQRQWDSAGRGGKVLKLRHERPYPGAGAAAAILRRSQGRGRVVDLTALAKMTARPGQAVRAELPYTPTQTGVISSIEWSFPDGTMRVGSRGLLDTPAESWAYLADGEEWSDSPVSSSWTAETI